MALPVKSLLRVCINHFVYRSKSHSQQLKEYSLNRKSRFIAKLLAENAAERKQWRKGLITHKVYGSSSLSPKRLEALNKIFLANITDGLTTSTWCNELADLGLMISKTELSHCGQTLKVMWSSCSSEGDIQVEKILEECKDELRDNIVTKSVGGYVPHILFTKDARATHIRDLEYIFSLPSVVKDLQTELPKDDSLSSGQDDGDQFKLEISTNILGLKRDNVLRRVIATAKRLRKAERRRKEEEGRGEEESEMSDEVPYRLSNIDAKKQKLAINNFIKKQMKAEKMQFLNSVEEMNLRIEMLENVSDDGIEDEVGEEFEEENCFNSPDQEEQYYGTENETDGLNLKESGETAEDDVKSDLFKR